MSRAFVKEEDGSRPEALTEHPVSSAPNLVTAHGLRLIEGKIAGLEAALAAKPDDDHAARLRRDLRYWSLRHATARPVTADPSNPAAQFGSSVTWRGEDGSVHVAIITGEDEADPPAGSIAWTSPVARALDGAVPGSFVTVTLRGAPVDLEVLAVSVPDPE